MAKKKEQKSTKEKSLDLLGFLSALIYMQSVLTVSHHTSMWVQDGSSKTVGPPAIPALVIGLLLLAYGSYRNKMNLSTLNVITFTIFITASLFWLSGLRTNFYF